METEQIIQTAQYGRDWVDYLSALLTPIIAVLGSVIALQQWRTNRASLKHDLFDRRYQQYTVVRDFIASIMTSGKSKPEEQKIFLAGTRGMRFIFDKEIASYIDDTVWNLAIDLECLESELQGVPAGEERSKNLHKQSDIKKNLLKELRNLDDRFSEYLQLRH